MTRDVAGPADRGPGHATLEFDILAALWEEVPFPRLPVDAPPEIRELVVNIENPRRVYAIHHSSRRHYLQLLVEKFVTQLRHGCGYKLCTTSSCFSCRKRVAGKAPLRRYNPTSARTLAVYLAGQDNPESRLCPHLQNIKGPSDAVKPLVFSSKHATTPTNGRPKHVKAAYTPPASPTEKSGQDIRREFKGENGIRADTTRAEAGGRRPLQLTIEEKAVSKDYRSFAANLFGTAAFKMLEWMTPNSLAAVAEKSAATMHLPDATTSEGSMTDLTSDLDAEDQVSMPSTISSSDSASKSSTTFGPEIHDYQDEASTLLRRGTNLPDAQRSPDRQTATSRPPMHSHRPPTNMTDTSTRIRTSSLAKPLSLSSETHDDFQYEDALVSPKSISAHGEVLSKTLVRPSSTMTRATSQVCLDSTFDIDLDTKHETMKLQRTLEDDQIPTREDEYDDRGQAFCHERTKLPETSNHSYSESREHLSDLQSYLPQSLAVLNPQAVNFICDVLQEDATAELHLLSPPSIGVDLKRGPDRIKPWKRRRETTLPYPRKLKLEWKLFVEQSIFNVLSDPRAVLDSFVTRDGVIDSQTLWYCMLRLTRVAPSLVFNSLWMAIAGLFAAPQGLQSSKPLGNNCAGKAEVSFTNKETGLLMLICFHALIAAAPLVTDPRQLHDVSRIRSQGLALASGGAVARQPESLCLQYEDAFTDEMALRLAKRLLTVISTRRSFDTLAALDLDAEGNSVAQTDVVDLLLAHLDSSAPPWLNFSKSERGVHEKRVPIIILDWARAVMLDEWKGDAVVPGDGPFGGALELMEAMYRKRNDLMVNEIHFRCEYFGERLDVLQMPVSWATSATTHTQAHLLDYPFIFSPASLISYFRSVNFSRMSRSYEESSSLQSRINTIITRDSLVTEPHQKTVLQNLLKVPAAKYLILDIGRQNVLRDAFDQLWRREERELMRPLKIHLGEDGGEQGFDSGGVQQEFFRLAIAEALNPAYGAFTVDEQTRMAWFQPGSLEPEWKYELVGILVSLAVYNGLTLPVTFPAALYRKLLDKPVTELHHIADGWPHLANGLTTLLDWNENDGAVEDVFSMTYEFSVSMLGQPVSREMQPEASSPTSHPETHWPQSSESRDIPLSASNPTDAPPVTADNRIAYVNDYIRYLTSLSVSPQFTAFSRGFRACLQPKSLTLLTPPLLQSLIEGTQEIDIHELRRTARYVGWDTSHRTVRDFWSIVKRYDERMKRKLLEFVTASDRVPVGGLANIQFVVQKNGEEDGEGGHLPTAYTCYGTLLLPEYRDKEVLRERLNMALENAQGFGFA